MDQFQNLNLSRTIKDLPPKEFKLLLYKTADLICSMYTDIADLPVYHSKEHSEISKLFLENLPETSTGIEMILEQIAEEVIPNTTLHYSPHFYAWIGSSASQASLLAEMVTTALNVNATTWMNAAAASEMEQQVIRWIGQFIDYHQDAKGVLLSGGSMANFTALKIGLTQKASYAIDETGFDSTCPLTIYVSEQNHFSIDKAVRALGVGTNNLRKIQTNPDYTIDLNDLENQIKQDLEDGFQPTCIIGNAGSVNTGAVDSICELSAIAKKYDLWLHLDGAYGGFAASTNLRDSLFKGLELANSISIDAHKWLFIPFECSALLVKEKRHLKESFSIIPVYQKFEHEEDKVDFSEYSLQQTRTFKALKVWMNFKTYGARQLQNSIQKSIDHMLRVVDLISNAKDFELMAPAQLSIVCFRFVPVGFPQTEEELNRFQKRIVKRTEELGTIFIRETMLRGAVVIRICCTNFRRERKHYDYLLEEIRRIGNQLLNDDEKLFHQGHKNK